MSWFTGTRAATAALGATVVAIATVVVAMAVTGVVGPTALVPPAAAAALPAFGDCSALAAWYRTAAKPLVTAYGLSPQGGIAVGMKANAPAVPVPAAPLAEAPMAAAESSGSSATGAVGNGPTGTNIQEAGVDEPDLVKTDGRLVVGLSGSRLWVAAASTDTPRVLGRLTLPSSSYASGLLLDGNRALVLGGALLLGGNRVLGGGAVESLPAGPMTGADVAPGAPGSTSLTVVDLSDPAAPRVVASEDLDGQVLSARLVAGVARVVLSSAPRLQLSWPATPQDSGNALARNRSAVATAPAQDWLPQRTIRDAAGRPVSHGPLLQCADVRHPTQPSGVQTLSVLTVDPRAAAPFPGVPATAVAASGDLVYASPTTLYVATSRWGSWQPARDPAEVVTQVHAFDIRGTGPAAYVASGSVPGFLLSQWAMSEQGGYLRVAVTTGVPQPPAGEGTAPSPSRLSQSSVVVLQRQGDRLVEVGHVDGLGRGELVRAVRWLGDLAAVVTFRQTDPLYLVDLSDPTAPRLRGALELTGYSAYLHPVGNGLLLGIGHEANAAGRIEQAQVSLFDVRDPAHPRRLAQRLLGTGWTQVESDPRAFTYLPGRGLAVLPFQSYGIALPVDGPAAGMPVRPSGTAVGITVSGGRLGDGGTLQLDGYDAVQRVLPVGPRLVAWTGSRLVTVDPAGLRVLGSVTVP